MAEFQEVIKHALRMEASNAFALTLDVYEDGMITSASIPAVPLAKFESIVMEWAKSNPEPRYPTFLEHVHSVFPNCIDDEICVEFLYGEKYRTSLTDCQHANCQQCWNRTIPDELAAKLGIKKQKIIPLIGVVK